MSAIEVARLEDLEEGTVAVVKAGAREVVLVRQGDDVVALRNSCPHMDTSFEGGSVIARAGGTPERPVFADGDLVLTCPWHRWEFSVRNGRCVSSDRYVVRTYGVTVEDGRVLVDFKLHGGRKER
jgi:nitrite reductase (NADH) small subunit